MTAHCALSKLNQCPAHWGSHQSSCRTPGPMGLMAHPRHPFIHAPLSPSSPTPGSSPPPVASLNYSSVYVSCQASVKNATAILEHQAGWGDGVNQCRHWVNNLHRYAEKYTPDLDFLQVVDKYARQRVGSLTLKDKKEVIVFWTDCSNQNKTCMLHQIWQQMYVRDATVSKRSHFLMIEGRWH